MDKPIYIDWKNSAFILKDRKLNYWQDEMQTSAVGLYEEYTFKGASIYNDNVKITHGAQITSSKTTRPERITFIPPNTQLTSTQYFLTPADYYFKLNINCQSEVLPRNDKPGKKTTIYYEEYKQSNSPLIFRNYLSFSFIEITDQYYVPCSTNKCNLKI